jgi:lysyl-tRNA synthetase class 2
LITHFPASQAALAKLDVDDLRFAERFELFYQGFELANGYHELLDPEVLRSRNRQANIDRIRDGKQSLPEDSFLLDAMDAGLPSSTGSALGFDRVVMLACKANRIGDVLAFPFERA